MTRKEHGDDQETRDNPGLLIKSAYRQLGGSASFYDGMMTYSTLPGKAVCANVWQVCTKKSACLPWKAWAAFAAVSETEKWQERIRIISLLAMIGTLRQAYTRSFSL